jgi:hypothetical protein
LGFGELIAQPAAAGPTHGEGRTRSSRWRTSCASPSTVGSRAMRM